MTYVTMACGSRDGLRRRFSSELPLSEELRNNSQLRHLSGRHVEFAYERVTVTEIRLKGRQSLIASFSVDP